MTLSRCVEAVEAGGPEAEIRTGGGTGTFAIDRELGVLNDLQLGSYALMDGQYSDALAADEGPRWFGDEHGLLTRPAGHDLAVGDRVELVPPHCDPTVDRYDVLHLVRGDVLVDVVPVDARGCSQ